MASHVSRPLWGLRDQRASTRLMATVSPRLISRPRWLKESEPTREKLGWEAAAVSVRSNAHGTVASRVGEELALEVNRTVTVKVCSRPGE